MISMKRTAFTLIELIVVVAVIALLTAVLAPALSRVRRNTRSVVCVSNIRQLLLAMSIYEQENHTFPPGFDDLTYGTVPPPGGYIGDASRDLQGWWWFHYLGGIMRDRSENSSVMICPSRDMRHPSVKANLLCSNYGVNRAICKDAQGPSPDEFVGTPLGLKSIRYPSETLLIVDSGYSLISWRGVTNDVGPYYENVLREGSFYVPGLAVNKERHIFPGYEEDARDGRHPQKKVNAGFADSHVSTLKADELFVEKTSSGYTNLSSLWLPK